MEETKATRPNIHIGYRVGRLTVVDKTNERKGGYTVWRCKCDCGNEILLDTRYLQRGTIQDCGCITKLKPGQRDITGLRFGKLIAVEPVEGKSANGTLWRCKCDCGGEVVAPLGQLTSGYRKSCGCLSRPPLEDLVGKKFGMLTVTGYAEKRNNKVHYWICVCECGKMTMVRQDYLKSGKTQSCGCLSGKMLKKKMRFVDGTSVTMLESVRDKRRSNNKSGYTGVYQDSRHQLWHARITFKGQVYDLGTYKTRKEAIKARMRGEEIHEDFLAWYYANYPKRDEAGTAASSAEEKRTEE